MFKIDKHSKSTLPKNSFLGSLCKRGHDYENTGKSLRYSKNKVCVVCNRENLRQAYANIKKKPEDFQKHREHRRNYMRKYRQKEVAIKPLDLLLQLLEKRGVKENKDKWLWHNSGISWEYWATLLLDRIDITVDASIALEKMFAISARSWLEYQYRYNLVLLKDKKQQS